MVYRKRRPPPPAGAAGGPGIPGGTSEKRKSETESGPAADPAGRAENPATGFLDALAAIAEAEKISLDRELAKASSSSSSGGASADRPLVSPPTPSNVSSSCPSNASSSTSLKTDGEDAAPGRDAASEEGGGDPSGGAGPSSLRGRPAAQHPAIHRPAASPAGPAAHPAPAPSGHPSPATDAAAAEAYRAAAAAAYAHAYACYAHHYRMGGAFAPGPPPPPHGPPHPAYYPHFANEVGGGPDGAAPSPGDSGETKKRGRDPGAEAMPDAATSRGDGADRPPPPKRRAVQDGGEDTQEKKRDTGASPPGASPPGASPPGHHPHHFPPAGYGYYPYYPPYHYAYPPYAAAAAAGPPGRHPSPGARVPSPSKRTPAAKVKGGGEKIKCGRDEPSPGSPRRSDPDEGLDVAALPAPRDGPDAAATAPGRPRRCVPLPHPEEGDAAGVHGHPSDDDAHVPLPPFSETVNYPEFLPGASSGSGTGGRGRGRGARRRAAPGDAGPAARRCVMCGLARPFCPGPARADGAGRSPAPASASAGATIPRQNKGVCTDCDVRVWLLGPGGRAVKWCKGCKNLRPWSAFGVKSRATKCGRCRERQRARYAADKLRGRR